MKQTEPKSEIGRLKAHLRSALLRLPGVGNPGNRPTHTIGARPGIENEAGVDTPPQKGDVEIQAIDFGPEKVTVTDVEDIDAFLDAERPDWRKVRWINVNGLHPFVVNRMRERFKFHTLAAEDVVHVPQRPKDESYDDHLFVIARMLSLDGRKLVAEQVSFFLFENTLITFQEYPGDVWNPIRDRIQIPDSRLRRQGPDYLLYTLLDAIVDQCFPILEKYGDVLARLEEIVISYPSPQILQHIHTVRNALQRMRRVIWPIRELMDNLYRDENNFFSNFAKPYLRDVYDHAVQVLDVLETYREMASALSDLYMSAVSNRMNEVMKVLTIMASFFIPITFIAGVYGMNLQGMPEIKWPYAYLMFWIVVACVVSSMLYYFYRNGWIGRSKAPPDSIWEDLDDSD